MEQIFLPASILTIFNVIVIIGGILYFRKQGGSQAAQDVIAIFEKRDTEQKEVIKELQKNYSDLKGEFGKLEGIVQEKDKKLQEYMSILQGRNPEQKQYMDDMRKFTSGVATYMDNSTQTLQAVSIFMQELNKQSMENRKWQKNRDRIKPKNYNLTNTKP